MKKYLAAVAAMSLVAAPAMAATPTTNPAASLSVAKSARAGAAPAKKNDLANGFGGFTIVAVAAVAVIIGVVLIAKDDLGDSN